MKPPPTTRPLPHPTELSAPHWQGAAEGKLMVQRCDDCGAYVFTPRERCRSCFGDKLRWVQSSGKGTVYSYTIVHRPPDPSFDPPYCPAIIELDEGWMMLSNVVEADLTRIAIGDPVEVAFKDMGDITLPVFRPADRRV